LAGLYYSLAESGEAKHGAIMGARWSGPAVSRSLTRSTEVKAKYESIAALPVRIQLEGATNALTIITARTCPVRRPYLSTYTSLDCTYCIRTHYTHCARIHPSIHPSIHPRIHSCCLSPAMALFRDFSFSAPSPLNACHEAERAAMNCSPTSKPAHVQADALYNYDSDYDSDCPPRRPLTPCTMGDLAQILTKHCLTIDTSVSACPPGLLTPPSDCDDQPAPRPTYSRISSSVLRMQRQTNSRLQCCASQARGISNLVRMLEQEDQCTVTLPSSSSSSASSTSSSPISTSLSTCGDDEAISMTYPCPPQANAPAFQSQQFLWRAGDRRDDCVRVSKTVRMRRRSSKDRDSTQKRR
jgi:hypothetical protein